MARFVSISGLLFSERPRGDSKFRILNCVQVSSEQNFLIFFKIMYLVNLNFHSFLVLPRSTLEWKGSEIVVTDNFSYSKALPKTVRKPR
jgi:hypothetical protein